MTDHHRDDAPTGRPSDIAEQRLRRRLRREVADLRTQLEERQLRVDYYLAEGYAEPAADALDEQAALLQGFRDRLGDLLADAAVEREAEQVLAGVPEAAELLGRADAGRVAVPDEPKVIRLDDARPSRGPWMRRVPAAVATAVAGIVAIAVVTVSSSPTGPNTLAVSSHVDDDPGSGRPEVADGPQVRGGNSTFDITLLLQRSSADGTASSAAIEHLLRRRRVLLERLEKAAAAGDVDSILELETLVGQLLDEIQQLDQEIEGVLDAEEGDPGHEAETASEAEVSDETPDGEPAQGDTDAAGDDEASDSEGSSSDGDTEDDEGLFGPWGEDETGQDDGSDSGDTGEADGSAEDDSASDDTSGEDSGQDDGTSDEAPGPLGGDEEQPDQGDGEYGDDSSGDGTGLGGDDTDGRTGEDDGILGGGY